MIACYKILVFGRVQMVLFRDSTRRKALGLGLVGYVKNLPDGSVEMVAQGEKEKLDELAEWVRRGPLLARVDRAEIEEIPVQSFEKFEIRF